MIRSLRLLPLILSILSINPTFAALSNLDRSLITPYNLMVNPGFEAGKGTWTASGGSFTIATSGSNLLLGAASGVLNASSASQTLTAQSVTIPEILKGNSGSASCSFKTAASDYKLQVTDGTNVLSEETIPAFSNVKQVVVPFLFPSSGSINLRIISGSDADDIAIDDCFLGSNPLINLSQASKVGYAKWPGTTDCFWTTTSNTYANFSADSDCTFPAGSNLGGILSAPATKVPGFTVVNLAPGKYKIVVTGAVYKSANANNSCFYRFHDGSNPSLNEGKIYVTDTATMVPVMIGEFEYTTAQSNITFQIQSKNDDNTNTCGIQNIDSDLYFSLYRYPSDSDTAVRAETINWFVDATIGGANGALPGTTTAFQEITNSGLTLTNQPGSLTAKIACSGTNPATGTTCAAGDESVGIVFSPPRAGRVEVCFSSANTLQGGVGTGAVYNSFKVVKTTNSSQTILSNGVQVPSVSLGTDTNADITVTPFVACGQFELENTSDHTFRLFNEVAAGGASFTLNQLALATNPGSTPISSRWTVRPIDQQIPAPVLIGSITTSSTGVERIERVAVNTSCTASPCTISSQSGSWVSSITRSNTGLYAINIPSGTFSEMPSCAYGANNVPLTNAVCAVIASTSTATTLNVQCVDGDTNDAQDGGFNFICMGPR